MQHLADHDVDRLWREELQGIRLDQLDVRRASVKRQDLARGGYHVRISLHAPHLPSGLTCKEREGCRAAPEFHNSGARLHNRCNGFFKCLHAWRVLQHEEVIMEWNELTELAFVRQHEPGRTGGDGFV